MVSKGTEVLLQNEDWWKIPGMARSFHHRCGSALTHPATLTALAVLLLNDLVFKSLWPGSWVTGKLSDLAWVVFASPLLAFLLSFLVARSAPSRRASFIASYIGLPLLYAAFNTFEPVHNLILRGLSIASGGTAGSPLDVTDSLVIPLGLVIAVWVWRRRVASPESFRLRGTLLMAGVAALASVATSQASPELGIREIGVSADGATHVVAVGRTQYRSDDGGLSWAVGSGDLRQIEWGGERVDTPRGRYEVHGPDILLVDADGRSEAVYSTAYMQEESNVWVQEHATTHLRGLREVAIAPSGIIYDERSGNLIAAMGIQGVVVGTSDRVWTRQAVGAYSPVNFSFFGKTGLLLSNGGFWTAALALSLSMTGVALVVSQFRRRDLLLLAAVAAVAVLALALFIGLPFLLLASGQGHVLEQILDFDIVYSVFRSYGFITLAIVFFFFTLTLGALALGFLYRESKMKKSLGLGLGILSLMVSGFLLLTFGGSDAADFSYYITPLITLGIPSYILGLSVLAIAGQELRHWRAAILTFLGMIVLLLLAFMLWLHVGIALTLAQASAIVLAALSALVLVGYIKRKAQSGQLE